MDTTMPTIIPKRSGLWAIILVILGLAAIALPLETSIGLVLIVGWILIISGATRAFFAFAINGIGNVLWELLIALLYLGLGLYFVTHPVRGLAVLTVTIGIFFCGEGATNLVVYTWNRKAFGFGWILADGVVKLLLGLMIWRHWPWSSIWVLGTLIGISMLMTGLTRLMVILFEEKRPERLRFAS